GLLSESWRPRRGLSDWPPRYPARTPVHARQWPWSYFPWHRRRRNSSPSASPPYLRPSTNRAFARELWLSSPHFPSIFSFGPRLLKQHPETLCVFLRVA